MDDQTPRTGLDLKVLRTRHQVKAVEIAREMGVSQSRISSLEREGRVSLEMLGRYLGALETCRTSGTSQTAPNAL